MVPEDPVAINFNDGQEEAEREIKFLCTRLLAGWRDLNVTDMQVSRISGGISNLLVKVEPPPPLHPVAVKVFGDKTELLIDREAEKQVLLRLNDAGFGAPVIGLFSNGRIERFLEARTLTPDDVCDAAFVPYIARRLRAFHDLQLHLGSAAGAAAAGSAADGSQSSQWDAIFGWLKMAESLSFAHDPAKQAAYDKVDFGAMRVELEDLRRACGRVASPRVLCHNDLLSANILLVVQGQPPPQQQEQQQQQQTEGAEGPQGHGDAVLGGGELQFIDFEYSCYGPRGFDFGNHFNEYAGFDCEYERFPSAEKQKDFFRHYLKPGELRRLAEEHLRHDHQHQHHLPVRQPPAQQATGSRQGPRDPAAAQEPSRPGLAEAAAPEHAAEALAAAELVVLERMVAEACVYALASHAYWGVWSFIQARYSPIDFDYLSYSKMRWDEYHRRKAEFYGLVDRLFPL